MFLLELIILQNFGVVDAFKVDSHWPDWYRDQDINHRWIYFVL